MSELRLLMLAGVGPDGGKPRGMRWVRENGWAGGCRCPDGHPTAEEALRCFRSPALASAPEGRPEPPSRDLGHADPSTVGGAASAPDSTKAGRRAASPAGLIEPMRSSR
jgi:hypothetical protein